MTELDVTTPLEGSKPRPLVAVLLSLFAPGAGHLYAGRLAKGLALWAVGLGVTWLGLFGWLPSTFVGLVVWMAGALLYYLWLAVSAAREATRASRAVPGRRRWPAVVGLVVLQAVLGSLPIKEWAPVRSFQTPSSSMAPTIQPGDHLMADVRVWNRRAPERGELVVYRNPDDPESLRLGRVIGLPGERFELLDKRVHADGKPIDDPWGRYSDDRVFSRSPYLPASYSQRDQFGPEVLPEGAVFVMGDNRDDARDSRFHGPVDRSLLVGRPLYLYWSEDRERIGQSLVAPR